VKARHLAREPRVSLTYWDAAQDVVTVHAIATWEDDASTRERVWQLFGTTPSPLGYDPGDFWPGPDDPAFGLLRLRPTRIDVTGLASSPGPRLTWRR
jgi:general stress protein 26